MTRHIIKGAIELGAKLPEDLEVGDSISDNNGKGRTVYVNQCSRCEKLLIKSTIILIPFMCEECNEFIEKVEAGYYDWI